MAEDDSWIEIPKVSVFDNNTFPTDYEMLKSMNYDGELTFTPIHLGVYKIVCSAYLEGAIVAEDSTIIKVSQQPVTVKIPKPWCQELLDWLKRLLEWFQQLFI